MFDKLLNGDRDKNLSKSQQIEVALQGLRKAQSDSGLSWFEISSLVLILLKDAERKV